MDDDVTGGLMMNGEIEPFESFAVIDNDGGDIGDAKDKQRMQHNTTEKKRKDRVRQTISKLKDVLPDDIKQPPNGQKDSTCAILDRVFDFVQRLQSENNSLLEGRSDDVRAAEVKRLNGVISTLKRENERYRELLDKAGIIHSAEQEVLNQWKKSNASDSLKQMAQKHSERIKKREERQEAADAAAANKTPGAVAAGQTSGGYKRNPTIKELDEQRQQQQQQQQQQQSDAGTVSELSAAAPVSRNTQQPHMTSHTVQSGVAAGAPQGVPILQPDGSVVLLPAAAPPSGSDAQAQMTLNPKDAPLLLNGGQLVIPQQNAPKFGANATSSVSTSLSTPTVQTIPPVGMATPVRPTKTVINPMNGTLVAAPGQPGNGLPSALILPNGQIVPVVTQPNMFASPSPAMQMPLSTTTTLVGQPNDPVAALRPAVRPTVPLPPAPRIANNTPTVMPGPAAESSNASLPATVHAMLTEDGRIVLLDPNLPAPNGVKPQEKKLAPRGGEVPAQPQPQKPSRKSGSKKNNRAATEQTDDGQQDILAKSMASIFETSPPIHNDEDDSKRKKKRPAARKKQPPPAPAVAKSHSAFSPEVLSPEQAMFGDDLGMVIDLDGGDLQRTDPLQEALRMAGMGDSLDSVQPDMTSAVSAVSAVNGQMTSVPVTQASPPSGAAANSGTSLAATPEMTQPQQPPAASLSADTHAPDNTHPVIPSNEAMPSQPVDLALVDQFSEPCRVVDSAKSISSHAQLPPSQAASLTSLQSTPVESSSPNKTKQKKSKSKKKKRDKDVTDSMAAEVEKAMNDVSTPVSAASSVLPAMTTQPFTTMTSSFAPSVTSQASVTSVVSEADIGSVFSIPEVSPATERKLARSGVAPNVISDIFGSEMDQLLDSVENMDKESAIDDVTAASIETEMRESPVKAGKRKSKKRRSDDDPAATNRKSKRMTLDSTVKDDADKPKSTGQDESVVAMGFDFPVSPVRTAVDTPGGTKGLNTPVLNMANGKSSKRNSSRDVAMATAVNAVSSKAEETPRKFPTRNEFWKANSMKNMCNLDLLTNVASQLPTPSKDALEKPKQPDDSSSKTKAKDQQDARHKLFADPSDADKRREREQALEREMTSRARDDPYAFDTMDELASMRRPGKTYESPKKRKERISEVTSAAATSEFCPEAQRPSSPKKEKKKSKEKREKESKLQQPVGGATNEPVLEGYMPPKPKERTKERARDSRTTDRNKPTAADDVTNEKKREKEHVAARKESKTAEVKADRSSKEVNETPAVVKVDDSAAKETRLHSAEKHAKREKHRSREDKESRHGKSAARSRSQDTEAPKSVTSTEHKKKKSPSKHPKDARAIPDVTTSDPALALFGYPDPFYAGPVGSDHWSPFCFPASDTASNTFSFTLSSTSTSLTTASSSISSEATKESSKDIRSPSKNSSADKSKRSPTKSAELKSSASAAKSEELGSGVSPSKSSKSSNASESKSAAAPSKSQQAAQGTEHHKRSETDSRRSATDKPQVSDNHKQSEQRKSNSNEKTTTSDKPKPTDAYKQPDHNRLPNAAAGDYSIPGTMQSTDQPLQKQKQHPLSSEHRKSTELSQPVSAFREQQNTQRTTPVEQRPSSTASSYALPQNVPHQQLQQQQHFQPPAHVSHVTSDAKMAAAPCASHVGSAAHAFDGKVDPAPHQRPPASQQQQHHPQQPVEQQRSTASVDSQKSLPEPPQLTHYQPRSEELFSAAATHGSHPAVSTSGAHMQPPTTSLCPANPGFPTPAFDPPPLKLPAEHLPQQQPSVQQQHRDDSYLGNQVDYRGTASVAAADSAQISMPPPAHPSMQASPRATSTATQQSRAPTQQQQQRQQQQQSASRSQSSSSSARSRHASVKPSKQHAKSSKSSHYPQVDTNLSNSIFDQPNRSMTPFAFPSHGAMQSGGDGPTYLGPGPFMNPGRPMSANPAASLQHKSPSDMTASTFNPFMARPQNAIGFNFQGGFHAMNHHSAASSMTSAQTVAHSASAAMPTHPHMANLSFPNLFTEGAGSSQDLSQLKFGHSNMASQHEASTAHSQQGLYQRGAAAALMPHQALTMNSILSGHGSHSAHGFDPRAAMAQTPTPFHGGHAPTHFGMPPINFPTMHDH